MCLKYASQWYLVVVLVLPFGTEVETGRTKVKTLADEIKKGIEAKGVNVDLRLANGSM